MAAAAMDARIDKRLDELRSLEGDPALAAKLPAVLKFKNYKIIKLAARLAGHYSVYAEWRNGFAHECCRGQDGVDPIFMMFWQNE